MVLFRVFRPLVVVLSLAAACKGDAGAGSPTPTPTPSEPAQAKPGSPTADDGAPGEPSPTTHREAAASLASIGDGPALAFVVRPEKWGAARATIADLIGDKAPPEIRTVLGAATVSDVLEQVGKQMLGLDLAALKGVDQTRPWVAGLGEAPVASPGLPNVHAGPAEHRSLGLRHVVLVPVTDGAAFVASLEPAMAPHLRPLEGWVVDAEPAYAAQIDDEGYIVVSVQGGYARVVVFSHVTGLTPAEARKALAPRLNAKPVAAVQTPALVELGRRDSLAAMHVRPWRLRDLATFLGTDSMMRAVATVTADQRATALAFGISSLLVAETVMVDEGLELDDWGWMLEAEGTQAQLLGVGSLTPHGGEVFDAAATTVALLPAVKTEAAALEGFVRLDINKGLAAVQPHRTLSKLSASESAETFAECGPLCLLHAAHRTPMQMLSTTVSWTSPSHPALPPLLALQGIFPDFDRPEGAIALLTAAPKDATAAHVWLTSVVGGEVDRLGKVDEVTRGSEGAFRLGFGVEPDAVLGTGERKVEPLLYVRAQGKGQSTTPLGKAVERLVGVMQVDRRGRTLITQLIVAADAEPKAAYAPDTSDLHWTSPILSRQDGTDAGCAAETALGIRKVFRAVAVVSADQRVTVLRRGFEELGNTLTCDAGDADAKAIIKSMTTPPKSP